MRSPQNLNLKTKIPRIMMTDTGAIEPIVIAIERTVVGRRTEDTAKEAEIGEESEMRMVM